MEERITKILQSNFAGAQLLDREPMHGNITGTMLWDGFARRTFLARQNKIVRVLRRELGPDMAAITHIFTYTPNEYEQMMAV